MVHNAIVLFSVQKVAEMKRETEATHGGQRSAEPAVEAADFDDVGRLGGVVVEAGEGNCDRQTERRTERWMD